MFIKLVSNEIVLTPETYEDAVSIGRMSASSIIVARIETVKDVPGKPGCSFITPTPCLFIDVHSLLNIIANERKDHG